MSCFMASSLWPPKKGEGINHFRLVAFCELCGEWVKTSGFEEWEWDRWIECPRALATRASSLESLAPARIDRELVS